jgi:hypothetical protein
MSVSAANVATFAPELAAVSTATVNGWLDRVARQINVDAYAARADDAQLFLTCHYVTLWVRSSTGQSGPSGPVSSQAAGKLSKAFQLAQSKSIGDDMLRATVYGQMFLRLRQITFADRVV